MSVGRNRARRLVARTLVVTAAVALAVAVITGGNAASGTPVSFTIAGSVERLYPGSSLPLSVTVTNEEHFPIVVTSVSASATDASAGCPASYLIVGSFTGALPVAARSTAAVTVRVALRHSAPDACQGALFPLAYSGRARKA